MTTTTTTLDLDAIEARAAHLYEYIDQPEEADVLAGTDVPALVAEAKCLRAELEQSKRGGAELGKTLVFLAELIKDAYLRGADDPIDALHMLGNYVAEVSEEEGGLSADDFNRVYRALEERRKGEAMVREQVAQELDVQGRKIADEAAYKVAAGDDGGFSGVLRGASISSAAKFVRGEVTA